MEFARKVFSLDRESPTSPIEFAHSRKWDAFLWRFPREILFLRISSRGEETIRLLKTESAEGSINDVAFEGGTRVHLSIGRWLYETTGDRMSEVPSHYSGLLGTDIALRTTITEDWSTLSKPLRKKIEDAGADPRHLIRLSERTKIPRYLATWKTSTSIHQQVFPLEGEASQISLPEYLHNTTISGVHPLGIRGSVSLGTPGRRTYLRPQGLELMPGVSWSWTRLGGVCWVRTTGDNPGIYTNAPGIEAPLRLVWASEGLHPLFPVEDWRGVVWAIQGGNLIRLQPQRSASDLAEMI